MDQASIGLANYIAESNERLFTVPRMGTSTRQEDSKEFKKRKREERMKEVRVKQPHGQFLREMDRIASDKSWEWLEKGHLKRHTEGLIMAAQSQSVRTNAIKAKIEKSQEDSRCRLCKKADETVNHLLSECPKLAQSEYKRRHDNVAKGIHWDICKQLRMECGDKWYDHNPEPMTKNEDRKILWDLTIQTDKKLPHNRPDLVVIDKAKKECHIIDVAFPGDSRIVLKKVLIVPFVIGALGSIFRQTSGIFGRYPCRAETSNDAENWCAWFCKNSTKGPRKLRKLVAACPGHTSATTR